ncbi:TonB-dependent receptor plug domain-containing protein [Alkalicaulis satelles]|uniref:TonB-dependent receptor plug domain-containing protein n=1 Tax=Alkalicaulis satelles TaxID=2609175 RepID=A0A5M6ZAA8_9PROT|nr:TonB-dependent receptor [Alkalicaulis satelles]KAA5801633.1 TonB-dependent receptor plug domain-containing protein [Alkalicaulis satelles]
MTTFRQRAMATTVMTAAAAALTGAAAAQVDVVTVTATKVEADAQSIPVAVSALDGGDLDELRVDNFTDYLIQLPGITAGGSGPGQSTIYIRGLASTTPNLTVAGVAGLSPNVAFYLDEQPLAQPGRNLDVYAVDLERVEVLPGPQGTLYGASSQAGTVRLITNKPVLGEFQASSRFGVSFTQDGDMSNKAEGVVNLPFGDNFAVRLVAYVDNQGGYIDNVAGTRNASESARFRPEGTVRANGVPVSAQRAGFQSTADLSGVTFLDADNAGLVQDNFNSTTYAGFRLSARYEFDPEWRLTAGYAQQRIEADGVFFVDPELDDLQIQRFEQDRIEDEFRNVNWTLEGRLGALDVVYTGAFTDRSTDQRVDYSDYLFVGQYLPYYICDGSVTYPGAADPAGVCQPPNLYVTSASQTDVWTHEARATTPQDRRIRATFGAFYSDLTLVERNDFTYPGMIAAEPFGPFAPNFPFPGAFQSDPGPFPAGVIFRNDVRRTDEQRGVFGEVTFDLVPDVFAVTLGARWYDIDVNLEGTANSSFCNSGGVDQNAFGTNISDLYDGSGSFTFVGSCDPALRQTFTTADSLADIIAAGYSPAQAEQIFNSVRAPSSAQTDGVITKVTATWTPTDHTLFYATYSEGFRPGLLNRPGGAPGPGDYTVPFALDTDDVRNYEIGWKTELFDRQLRFNGSAFYVEIDRLQTTIFDPSIVNLFFSDNAADAEIRGVEGDFVWAPMEIPGLTVAGAFSILDTEITRVITPTDDVTAGSDLAFAPSLQGNLRARYEWGLDNGWMAHVMPQMIYSDGSRSDVIDINSANLSSYTVFSLSGGLTADQWSVELFADNITNERAQLSNNFVFDRERVTIMRPRTIGLRVGVQY